MVWKDNFEHEFDTIGYDPRMTTGWVYQKDWPVFYDVMNMSTVLTRPMTL